MSKKIFLLLCLLLMAYALLYFLKPKPNSSSFQSKNTSQTKSPPLNALLQAATSGDRSQVLEALQHGISVKSTDPYGNTALILAVYNNHPEIVQILLDHQSDIHAENKSGMTALMYAAYIGEVNLMELLYDKGAKQAQTNMSVSETVIIALRMHKPESVNFFLLKGHRKEVVDSILEHLNSTLDFKLAPLLTPMNKEEKDLIFSSLMEQLKFSKNKPSYYLLQRIGDFGIDGESALPLLSKIWKQTPRGSTRDSIYDQLSEVMSKIGPSAVPFLLEALDYDAYGAAQALKKIGKIVLPALLKKYEETSKASLKKNLIYVLEQLGPLAEEAGTLLVQELKHYTSKITDSTREMTGQIRRALKAIGPSVIPDLLELMGTKNETLQLMVIQLVKEVGSSNTQAGSMLKEMLQHPNKNIRTKIALALFKTAPQEEKVVLSTLAQLLRDSSPHVILEALSALGEVGPPARGLVPTLIQILKSDPPDEDYERESLSYDNQVYQATITTLGKIGPDAQPAVLTILSFIQEKEHYQTETILKALLGIGPGAKEAVPNLISIVKKETRGSGNLHLAIQALGKIGPEASSAIPILQKIFRSGDSIARREAFFSLVAISSSEEKKELLLQAVTDSELEIQTFALQKIDQLGTLANKLIPDLIKKLKSSQYSIRLEAIDALGKIGPPAYEAIPFLIDREVLTHGLDAENKNVRAAIKIDPTGKYILPLLTKPLEDPFSVRSAVFILEALNTPESNKLAQEVRKKWKL